MDQFSIKTPDLYLRQGVMEDSYPLLRSVIRSAGRYQVTKNREGDETWATIKLGPGAATHINVRKEDDVLWRINSIRIALPRWLWGHNGRFISDHEELLLALYRFHTVVGLLVEDRDRHRLLPGLGEGNSTYWSSIEFPVHLPDPDGRVLEAMKNMRHRDLSRTRASIRESSATLSGAGLLIRAYDKENQLNRVKEREDLGTLTKPVKQFVRIECKWSGDLLRDRLEGARQTPSEVVTGNGNALVSGLSYETLRKCFDQELENVVGVFVPDKFLKGKHVVPRLLAQIAFVQELPLESVLTCYRVGGFGSPRTIREHEQLAKGFYAEKMGVSLQELLASSSPGLFVRSRKAEDQVEKMTLPDGPIPESMRLAFLDVNSTSRGSWLPAPLSGRQREDSWRRLLPWPECLPVLQGRSRAEIFAES